MFALQKNVAHKQAIVDKNSMQKTYIKFYRRQCKIKSTKNSNNLQKR